jgi:hypothetical protein
LDEIGSVVYEEMSFKVKVYGRRTDDGRTQSDHKSSPCHFVTGELKILSNYVHGKSRSIIYDFSLATKGVNGIC